MSGAHVEIEIAQKLLSSELLVQEDEDFISNFILTDEALEQHRQRLKALEDGSGEARYIILIDTSVSPYLLLLKKSIALFCTSSKAIGDLHSIEYCYALP